MERSLHTTKDVQYDIGIGVCLPGQPTNESSNSKNGNNNKKKKRKIKVSEKEGYTFDDEDVETWKGKKHKKQLSQFSKGVNKTKTEEDPLTPGNLTNCQTIVCSSIVSFLLCGAGTALILTGYLIFKIPDIYKIVGPIIIAFGLIIYIYALVLCIRRIQKRLKLRQVSNEGDGCDTDNVASIGYPVHCLDTKITVDDVNCQRRPSVVELYGSVQSIDAMTTKSTSTPSKIKMKDTSDAKDGPASNYSLAIAHPTNPALDGDNSPTYIIS